MYITGGVLWNKTKTMLKEKISLSLLGIRLKVLGETNLSDRRAARGSYCEVAARKR